MAEMAKNKVSVMVDDDVHLKVKSTAPLRGTNLEGAYDQALRAWLGDKPDPAPQYSPQDEKWHRVLADLLRSGDRDAISAIKQNLQMFHRIVKPESSADVAQLYRSKKELG